MCTGFSLWMKRSAMWESKQSRWFSLSLSLARSFSLAWLGHIYLSKKIGSAMSCVLEVTQSPLHCWIMSISPGPQNHRRISRSPSSLPYEPNMCVPQNWNCATLKFNAKIHVVNGRHALSRSAVVVGGPNCSLTHEPCMWAGLILAKFTLAKLKSRTEVWGPE
jgi:hypothetical protein